MRAVILPILVGLIGGVAGTVARADASAPQDRVAALVQQLGDPDPAVRAQAEDELARLGPAAREALERAAESDDPEIANRAMEVLLQLPLTRPGDSPAVRELLANYAAKNQEGRRRDLETLYNLRQFGPLVRVIGDEPAGSVRWFGVAMILQKLDPDIAAMLRELDVERANSSILILAGYGWLQPDPERAMELFRQAIALEAVEPTLDEIGIVDQVIERLVERAVNAGAYTDAARLLRQQIARGPSVAVPYGAIGRLFALHAAFGPLPSFASDLATYGTGIRRASVTDRVAGTFASIGVPLRTMVLYGHVRAHMPQAERAGAGEFLMNAGRLELAEMELAQVLELDDGPLDPQLDLLAAYRLSHIAGTLKRDEDAARYLERVMQIQNDNAIRLMARSDDELRAEIEWRRLRAARDRGDAAGVHAALEKLAAATPAHADVALDVIPELEKLGRREEADRHFDRTYGELHAKLSADPQNPEHMNNIAWLCARSDRRLDEALELATKAIELAPDNPAFLDTAAEAHFRKGNADEAVRLEERAVQLRPHDTFMKEQLARFRAGR